MDENKSNESSLKEFQAKWEAALERAAEEEPRQKEVPVSECEAAGMRVKAGIQGGCAQGTIPV